MVASVFEGSCNRPAQLVPLLTEHHCDIVHEGNEASQHYLRPIVSSLSELSAGWLTLASPFHCPEVQICSLIPGPFPHQDWS